MRTLNSCKYFFRSSNLFSALAVSFKLRKVPMPSILLTTGKAASSIASNKTTCLSIYCINRKSKLIWLLGERLAWYFLKNDSTIAVGVLFFKKPFWQVSKKRGNKAPVLVIVSKGSVINILLYI